MQYLKYIVNRINLGLLGHFDFVPSAKKQICDIAKLAKRERGDKSQVWPAYWDGEEYQFAGVDEDYDLIIYHRQLSMTSAVVPGGYGDSVGHIKNSVKMCMVVFGSHQVIGHSSDELALHIQAMMPGMFKPETLKPTQLRSTSINITDIVLNEEQVFNEEYKSVDYFIKPEHIYFKVNYTIESTFDKNCFNKCSCKTAAK